MKYLSQIKQNYKIMPELHKYAFSQIEQGHETIYIKVLAILGKAIKLYNKYISTMLIELGRNIKLYQSYAITFSIGLSKIIKLYI